MDIAAILRIACLAACVPLMAFTHRLRGGGFIDLPVKGTYFLWVIPGLLAWGAGAPWPVALAWGVGYFIWILPAWIVYLTQAVGAVVPADQKVGWDPSVPVIWFLSAGHAAFACYLRAGLFLLPLAAAISWYCHLVGGSYWAVLPAVLPVISFLPAYRFGFRELPQEMSALAEPVVGAFWGLFELISLILLPCVL